MKKVIWFIKLMFGLGSISNGSICWFSNRFYDVHDYHTTKGGDGIPSHFYKYTCPNCDVKFWI